MKQFGLCILLFFVYFLAQGQAQGYYLSNYEWNNMQKVSLDQPMTFVDYPYESPFLDLRDFLLRFPETNGRIPEYVEVQPPPGVDLEDLYYSVGYISSADGSTGVLILFFIDQYDGANPRMWIDGNLNRDFRDDGYPVVFKKSRQKVAVKLKHDAERAMSFHFSVVGPELDPFAPKIPDVKEPSEVEYSALKTKPLPRIPTWLSFNIDVGYALGRVTYLYQNLNTGFPVSYKVTSNHKGFRAGLGVHLKDFRFSATAGFNHFFYWTSYKEVRLGEPFYVCDPQCTRYENIEKLRNRDIHPDVRWDFGAQIAWEPFVTKDIRLGPFVEPQIWKFSGNTYFEKINLTNVAYELGPEMAIRTGLSFWVKAGLQSYFRLEFSAAWSRFRPQGFFDSVNLLDDQQRSLGINLGYGF